MIDQITFTKEWIASVRAKNKKADPELIEKATKALYLLECLSKTDLDFIFKGGTSLMLLLDKLHRFSIDIDIIVEKNRDDGDIDKVLRDIVADSPIFYKYEENIRTNNKNLPKAHFKVYYKSVQDDKEKYVLLDILFEKNKYKEIIHKDIDCNLIKCTGPEQLVKIPSIDCILADKLTAFAPNTTGIPYGKDKELEIIKQLFDVSNLFDNMRNIETVKETFVLIADQELEYRNMQFTHSYEDVLDDVLETAGILGARGRLKKDTFALLEYGVSAIKNYVFSQNYIIDIAVGSAAKAAYLSLLLKNGINEIERYNERVDLKLFKIDAKEFKPFKSMMKYNKEAYFYWCKSFELIEKYGSLKQIAALD